MYVVAEDISKYLKARSVFAHVLVRNYRYYIVYNGKCFYYGLSLKEME